MNSHFIFSPILGKKLNINTIKDFPIQISLSNLLELAKLPNVVILPLALTAFGVFYPFLVFLRHLGFLARLDRLARPGKISYGNNSGQSQAYLCNSSLQAILYENFQKLTTRD